MGEIFGYIYVMGAVGTALLSAYLYLKIYFDTEEKNQSLFGWIFTCVAMCPVWALIWPFVIKGIWNDLSNFEKNKKGAIKQREHQDWVAGFQEDMDKPPPPWIDPKRFGNELSKKNSDRDEPLNQAKPNHTASNQKQTTNINPRQTSETIRRDAFKQRYMAAQILAKKHTARLEAEAKEKEKLANPSVSQIQKVDGVTTSAQIETPKQLTPAIKTQSTRKDSHTKSTISGFDSIEVNAFTKTISCPVCRYDLTIDVLDRETKCKNCRQHIVIT
jgi:hypothetical protein